MLVLPSALSHESQHGPQAGCVTTERAPLLAAIAYPNDSYPQTTFERVVVACRARGLKLAGVLQRPVSADPARRCDVALEDLMSGHRTELFERRGAGARGCRLDLIALTEVSGCLERALRDRPDLLVLNKFGKVESEGRGLLDVIAVALDRNVPVIIGVPYRNVDCWRQYAGEMAIEFADDTSEIMAWLDQVCPAGASRAS